MVEELNLYLQKQLAKTRFYVATFNVFCLATQIWIPKSYNTAQISSSSEGMLASCG